MKSAMPATPVQLALPLELQLGVLTTSFRETLTQRLPPMAIPWPPKKQPAPRGAGGGPNSAWRHTKR